MTLICQLIVVELPQQWPLALQMVAPLVIMFAAIDACYLLFTIYYLTMKKLINSKQGFTLFELLVVISIIGILMSLVAISYSNAQVKARDSRAKQDIKAMSDAFEQYYAANDTYAVCATMAVGTWAGSWPPLDPRSRASGEADYSYTTTCAVDSYIICAELEQGRGGNSSDTTPTWENNGAYFCLVNQQ